MFNIFEELPTSIEYMGKTFNVDMSFDNIIRVEAIKQDETLFMAEKIESIFECLFDIEPIEDYEVMSEMIEVATLKLIQKQDEEESIVYDLSGNPMPKVEEANGKSFDLLQDMEYIYSSFMLDYKIDLFEERGRMHWWKFTALLDGLSESTRLSQVIRIRTMDLPTGKGTQKDKERIMRLKRKYKLKGAELDGEE